MGGWEVSTDWQQQAGTVPFAEDLLCDRHQRQESEDNSFPVKPITVHQGRLTPKQMTPRKFIWWLLTKCCESTGKGRLILSGGHEGSTKKKTVTYGFGLEDPSLDLLSGKGGQDKEGVKMTCWAQGLQRLLLGLPSEESAVGGTASGFSLSSTLEGLCWR